MKFAGLRDGGYFDRAVSQFVSGMIWYESGDLGLTAVAIDRHTRMRLPGCCDIVAFDRDRRPSCFGGHIFSYLLNNSPLIRTQSNPAA